MQPARIGRRIPNGHVPISVCDRCGAVLPSSQLRTEWTGLRTCVGNANGGHNCWEPKHPSLDFEVMIDASLTNVNPRQPRDDVINPPMTYSELVASLKKGSVTP